MKKLTLSLIGALTMLLAGSAFAQTVHIRVTVPFDFTVNHKALPAGEYEVLSANQGTNGILQIRHLGGPMETYVSTSNLQSGSLSSSTKLVFEQYGNMYFLSELWTEGNRAGWEFPKAKSVMTEARNAGRQIVLVAQN